MSATVLNTHELIEEFDKKFIRFYDITGEEICDNIRDFRRGWMPILNQQQLNLAFGHSNFNFDEIMGDSHDTPKYKLAARIQRDKPEIIGFYKAATDCDDTAVITNEGFTGYHYFCKCTGVGLYYFHRIVPLTKSAGKK